MPSARRPWSPFSILVSMGLKIVGVLQIRNVVTCLSNHVRQVGGALTTLSHTAVDSDASASFLSDTTDGLTRGRSKALIATTG